MTKDTLKTEKKLMGIDSDPFDQLQLIVVKVVTFIEYISK